MIPQPLEVRRGLNEGIESHRFPDELVPQVVELRKLFDETIELFDKATNPLISRTPASGFGRKVSNQGFGRI